jgi:AcrR family transcriptional regulator
VPAAEVRRGRRPGASTTRQDILDAARARFASDGFAATTIRRVAADAGVNPSLVMQFFTSKEELFAAVMSISPKSLARFNTVFDDPDAALRAGLASSMLVGLTVGRRLVGVPILANAEVETLVRLAAPAIQSVLTRSP